MCESDVNIKVMQSVLGHADAVTTLNIYTDATREFTQNEIQDFGNRFIQKSTVK